MKIQISVDTVTGAVVAMEKPPFMQNQNCGDWELKERLGMGGFAHVYLYQHHVSVVELDYKNTRKEGRNVSDIIENKALMSL